MSPPAISVLLMAGYGLALVAIAWGFDVMARRTSLRAARWRTGMFDLPRRPRRMAVSAGSVAVADVVRSAEPTDALPRQAQCLQRLSGQVDLHDIGARPGDQSGD